jgi:hypothetical protein
MKKLVLVVAMFMFVCGGSFLVKAQNSEKAATAQSEVNAALIVNDTVVKDTVTKKDEPVKTELSAPTAFVNDTVVKDTVTKKDEPVKTELSAPTAFVNDTVVKDTASKDKPAEPVKE